LFICSFNNLAKGSWLMNQDRSKEAERFYAEAYEMLSDRDESAVQVKLDRLTDKQLGAVDVLVEAMLTTNKARQLGSDSEAA
jgi:hypothetical protein